MAWLRFLAITERGKDGAIVTREPVVWLTASVLRYPRPYGATVAVLLMRSNESTQISSSSISTKPRVRTAPSCT